MSPFIIGFLLIVAAGGGFAFGNMAGREHVASQGELGELKGQVLALEEAKTESETKAEKSTEALRDQTLELSRQLTEEADKRREASRLRDAMASDILDIHRSVAEEDSMPRLKKRILDITTRSTGER
jgi:ribosomal protein L9